jgi:ABC-2 type transport system permease protein
MSRFRTVFLFELKGHLKNKVVVGVTIFLILASAVLLFSPRFTGGDAGPKQAAEDRPVMLVRAEEPEEAERLQEIFGAVFTDYDVRETSLTAEEIRGQILDGEITCAFDIGGPDSCTYYVNNLGMTDQAARQAAAVLQEDYRVREMEAAGIPAEKAAGILNHAVQVETVKLGKDQSFTFFYTYIMIFALYMVILMYGQMIATNVANEKSSRTMELLVTSVNTNAMIFGKVLATCLVGLIQLALIFGSSMLFYHLNSEFWVNDMVVSSIFNPPPALLLQLLLFFFLGFLVYAFLYGAVGSMVSRLEETTSAVMPVTMLFMISFFLVVIPLASGDTESTMIRICSFVPFSSPVAMFTRIAMGSVPLIEILLSVAILVLSVVLIGFLAARIYRAGVLLYGVKPSPAKIIAMLKKDRQGN